MSIREALNAAMSEVDDEAVDNENTEVHAETAMEGGETDTGAQAEAAEHSPDASESETGKEGAEAGEQLSSAEAAESDPSPTDKPNNNSLKAPVDWSPKEREQWSKIPRQLQERIIARERDMAQTMASTKEARQTYEAVSQVSQQFGSVLAADGFRNPVEAMQAAFGTMAALRMGTPQQKAQEIARIIGQYGVDIGALDDALVGTNPQAQQNPNSDIDRLLQERLAPMQDFMQQFQSQQQMQQQQVKQQADQQVQEFAQQAEFLNDVREDMADILTTAAKRGVNLTLQQAYDRACAAHPEISQIITERKRQEAILGGQKVLHGKQHAASSISGQRVGTGSAPTDGSVRGSIEAAWDQVTGG